MSKDDDYDYLFKVRGPALKSPQESRHGVLSVDEEDLGDQILPNWDLHYDMIMTGP